MIACAWALALVSTAAFGLIVKLSVTTARTVAPVFVVLALVAWAVLTHHVERTHHRDR